MKLELAKKEKIWKIFWGRKANKWLLREQISLTYLMLEFIFLKKISSILVNTYQAGIYLFGLNNKNTRARYEIFSK